MEDEHVEQLKEKEEKKGKSPASKVIDFVAGPEEKEGADEEDFDEYEQKDEGKGSFFASVKKWFSGSEEDEDESASEESPAHPEKSQQSSLSPDIRDVLKIQNKWIARLPPAIIKEFRESPDYQVYKDTLQKYGLIKVK